MLLYQPLFNKKSVSGPYPVLWFEGSLRCTWDSTCKSTLMGFRGLCVFERQGDEMRSEEWGPWWVQQLVWRGRAMWASAFDYFLTVWCPLLWCRKMPGSRLWTRYLQNREWSRPLVFINRVPDICYGCSGWIKSHCAHSYGKMSKYGYEKAKSKAKSVSSQIFKYGEKLL